MTVYEVNAVLQVTDEQEEKLRALIARLREQGQSDWTSEKILSFAVSGLMSDYVDEMLARFERIVEMGEGSDSSCKIC